MNRILLVEDNEADALLLQEAFRVASIDAPVDHVTDGEQAMSHLRSAASRPGLMLLDLNLPRMDGREVLSQVKGDPALREIPVIVLTTSAAPSDVELAYDRGANAFVRKPLGMDRLVEAAEGIRDFWFRAAVLPSEA
jgi:chemotaxis family two-component system response regulator Rcp1